MPNSSIWMPKKRIIFHTRTVDFGWRIAYWTMYVFRSTLCEWQMRSRLESEICTDGNGSFELLSRKASQKWVKTHWSNMGFPAELRATDSLSRYVLPSRHEETRQSAWRIGVLWHKVLKITVTVRGCCFRSSEILIFSYVLTRKFQIFDFKYISPVSDPPKSDAMGRVELIFHNRWSSFELEITRLSKNYKE